MSIILYIIFLRPENEKMKDLFSLPPMELKVLTSDNRVGHIFEEKCNSMKEKLPPGKDRLSILAICTYHTCLRLYRIYFSFVCSVMLRFVSNYRKQWERQLVEHDRPLA